MAVAERPSEFSPEEVGIPLPPELQMRFAIELKQAATIEEGIKVRQRIEMMAINQVREEIRQRDQRIVQLETEIKSTKNSPSLLSPVSPGPTAERVVEKESQSKSWQEWVKGFLGNILGRRRPPVARSRLLGVHEWDKLLQSPGGIEKIQEMAKKAEKQEERRKLWQTRRKQFVHSLATFLVLGPLLVGSGAPASPSTGKESRQSRGSEITLFSADQEILEHQQILKMRRGYGKPERPLSSQKPVEEKQPSLPTAKVMSRLRVEKRVSKPSIKVVITEGNWFLQAANQEVADWLWVNHYNNWQNGENKVWKSEVIAKILADELEAQGVNPEHVLPGQIFVFDLGKNEKVVKVARTGSFQEYY